MSILALCKFTPLGFETRRYGAPSRRLARRVNLPRWGLKQPYLLILRVDLMCKFTPLGFETSNKFKLCCLTAV